MIRIEKIASYFGLALIAFGIAFLWLINWILGLSFSLFTAAVLAWYLFTKKVGDDYLRKVAEKIGCTFEGDQLAFGSVYGRYRDRKIEISVAKSFNTSRGLAGLALSYILVDSLVGAVSGISNFTLVKIEHQARVTKPYQLDDRTYVAKSLVLYLPKSSSLTGIPSTTPEKFVLELDRLIEKLKVIEKPGKPARL